MKMAIKSVIGLTCTCLAVYSFLFAGSTNAAIITPVSVDASSTCCSYSKDNLINDSGLNGALHDGIFSGMWMNDAEGASGSLNFDLGGIFYIISTDIWQYNYINHYDRGVLGFDISGSTDGAVFTPITSASLAISPGGPIAAQNVMFNSYSRYIRFDISSNHGDSSYTGLSEVKFDGDTVPPPSAIPLPATIWLFGSALFGLVAFGKRRKAA